MSLPDKRWTAIHSAGGVPAGLVFTLIGSEASSEAVPELNFHTSDVSLFDD